ncbi:MAG: class I SAM-dependent methyltransferase [Gammaproteobacteria bacterium]|nr:class I SAM-dependent methyltransferase [Gammaproteobacteria bacterium]
MTSRAAHWDRIFSTSEDETLGWYENYPEQTLELLQSVPKESKNRVFLSGAGTSTLVQNLLDDGHELVINDISQQALDKTASNIKASQDQVCWLNQDIGLPIDGSFEKVDLWLDRAVLHFLTQREQIEQYVLNVRQCLKPDGYLMLAEFAENGAEKCAGLPVHRYSLNLMQQYFGQNFELIKTFNYDYVAPHGGTRPYIYALFQYRP